MKIWKSIVTILLLLAVTLSCKLLNRTKSGGLSDDDVSRIASALPAYDPTATPPSPGAIALRRLAELEPSASTLSGDVELVERAALKKLRSELRVLNTDAHTDQASSPVRFETSSPVPVVAMSSAYQSSLSSPALLFLQGTAELGAPSVNDAALISGLISGFSDMFGESLTESGSVNKTTTETKDGITSTLNVELGRGEDGAITFGFGIKSEGTKNGVAIKADVAGRIDGQRCPNAEGQVSFTIKVRLGAQLNQTAYTQELTAFVRAVVNDDAKLASNTIEVIQGTRQVKDGRSFYIETGETFSNDTTGSNYREIRLSQQARPSDGPLSAQGLAAAYSVGRTALAIAETNWYSGGCTSIEANSPGTVAPSSRTAIPVKVRQRFDKSEVPCKLLAALKGGTSIEPTTLARTAGTLNYTAPAETSKSATISLTATSRRGRATLDLTANTGGQSYTVSGVSNGVSFSGKICSLSKPFTLDATFPGGTAKTTFTPSTEAGGTTSVSGGGGGCVHSGGGNYSITVKQDNSASLTWTTTDKLACPGFSNSRTGTFTLLLQPADLACP